MISPTHGPPYITRSGGFTLLELLLVMVVMAVLANVAIISGWKVYENTRLAVAVETVSSLHTAAIAYYTDVGFYPPDVWRGWDPGFTQPLPANSDLQEACTADPSSCPDAHLTCSWCPDNWQSLVLTRWRGPYINAWPVNTPWGGKYDFNPWVEDQVRNGCNVPRGIYIGFQGDYNNGHTVPPDQEVKALQKQIDNDGCLDGEVELLIAPAP